MKHQDPIDPITGKYAFLVDPGESIIYELDRGMLDKVYRAVTRKSSLDEREIITDKRLYYYRKNSAILDQSEIITTLDLKDITATEMIAYNKTGMLVFGIILSVIGIGVLLSSIGAYSSAAVIAIIGIVLLALGIAMIITYFKTRSRLFVIHYAGGNLKFNLQRYNMETVKNFQRELYHSKSLLR